MKRRNWDPKTKATIVLQGLKGQPIVDLCNEHQISQTQYYLWREEFLMAMASWYSVTTTASQSCRIR